MTQSKISPSEGGNQLQDAYRYSLMTAGVMALAVIGMLAFFGMPPNLYDATYWAAVVCLVALLSAWLIKQGRLDLGLGLLIGAIQTALLISSIKTSGLGVAFAAVGVTTTFSLSHLMTSRRLAVFANIASMAMAALLLAFDFFEPFERVSNGNATATWIIAGGVILAYAIIMLRQSWGDIINFMQSSIRNRLTAIVVGAAIIPVVLISIILGWTTYIQVRNSLTKDAFDKLAAVQNIKANQIEGYLAERQSDMVALRETMTSLFTEAQAKMEAIDTLKHDQIARLFQTWDADVRDVASDPGVVAGMRDLASGFQSLGFAQARSLYLGKEQLQSADDGSDYSRAHVEQHGFFTGYTAIHGYVDAFLIDPAGNVVYSVHKTDIFGTNLTTGTYQNSGLASLYQNLLTAPAGKTYIADATIFEGEYVMFIGTPIYEGPTLVGILAYQLPLDVIKNIMAERTGQGETGETYLIALEDDGRITYRSDRTTVGNGEFVVGYDLTAIATESMRNALGGKTGSVFTIGSTGEAVLHTYRPLDVEGLNWAVMDRVTVAEALSPKLRGSDKDFITAYKENYGYYDIFLIEPNGFIFYTVVREADYKTNILTGEYATTNLGLMVADILKDPLFKFSDFAAYAPSGGKPAAFFGLPILGADNQVEMIVAAQVSLDQINAITGERTGLGTTGETYLVGQDQLWRSDSRFLADLGVETTVLNEKFKVDTVASRSALVGESGQQVINDYRGTSVLSVWSPLRITKPDATHPNGQTWALLAEIDQSEALAPVNALAGALGLVIGLALLGIGALAVFLSARFAIGFVTPILNLTNTATQVAAGNMNLSVEAKSRDEIGTLSSAFNSMTSQLRDLIGSLESRVAERTQSLELAAEVGRSVSQVRALDVMLKDAAELIRSRFDLYYVQVYLADPSQTNLILQSGTGTVGAELVGRGHRLPLNTNSINGRAAIEKRSVVVSDTAANPTFLPNPLLPETRSEMAVPLLIGEKVVGVLDLQSQTAGALNQEVLTAFEALAGQLAIAIQNATFLAETQQARAEVEAQARRLTRANWADYLDAIYQPEEIGFVFEKNRITPLTQTEPAKDNAFIAPIAVTGEAIGNLVVEMEGRSPIARTDELLNAVARQVAQQVENLRLLESAERYRTEAENAARRLTREGWEEYFSAKSGQTLGYLYDLKEVRPHKSDVEFDTNSSLSLPIKVRDETIGKLAVLGVDSTDPETLALVNAVSVRLSEHIESIRLLEETQLGQMELNKRARQLASVSQISTLSSRELDVQKMLATVVQMAQRQFGLYHAHIFTYNKAANQLEIVACGWKEGDEHEGTHGTTAIPLDQEQSLVARAARTRAPVAVNDVRADPNWLPNPMLPDTLSELAVPLVIGDEMLGVLDVQSEHTNAFSDADINIQSTLAAQVATALQNARSFARAQRQAEREATLNAISQKIQSATSVEAVLQIAARELGHALGAPRTIAQLSMKDNK